MIWGVWSLGTCCDMPGDWPPFNGSNSSKCYVMLIGTMVATSLSTLQRWSTSCRQGWKPRQGMLWKRGERDAGWRGSCILLYIFDFTEWARLLTWMWPLSSLRGRRWLASSAGLLLTTWLTWYGLVSIQSDWQTDKTLLHLLYSLLHSPRQGHSGHTSTFTPIPHATTIKQIQQATQWHVYYCSKIKSNGIESNYIV